MRLLQSVLVLRSIFLLATLPMMVFADIRIERDITYLTPDRDEKLDAYLPSPARFAGPHPAVLLIHGGGWRSGSKADARERNIAHTLASHGYAVFSIDYLLNVNDRDPVSQKTRTRIAWPTNFHDCKSALRFIRAESARFGVDPQRIGVMGGSAGGHLSLLVGATANDEEMNRHGLYSNQSNAVACILSFYGDYDIRGRAVSPFAGATPQQTAANETAASPITYLDAQTPPTFITHGTADKTVLVERSRLLAKHLRGLGVEHIYVEVPRAPHSYHLQPKEKDLRPSVLEFLAKHLGKPAQKSSL